MPSIACGMSKMLMLFAYCRQADVARLIAPEAPEVTTVDPDMRPLLMSCPETCGQNHVYRAERFHPARTIPAHCGQNSETGVRKRELNPTGWHGTGQRRRRHRDRPTTNCR